MGLIEAARLAGFRPEDGWPTTLTPEQVLRLQHARLGMPVKDFNGSPAVRELHTRMGLAIQAGVLKHTTTEREEQVEPSRRIISKGIDGGRSFLGGTLGSLPVGYMQPPKFKTVKVRHIAAADFAAWLAANVIEPSPYTSAWFKALAVNTDPRRIEPPAQWKAQTAQGLQRCDDTDAGRLVRVADLVQWLMKVRVLPCRAAVELVCKALEQSPSAAAGWLYLLTKADYAQPLPAAHPFFVDTFGEMEEDDKGLPGAIKHMRQLWGSRQAPDVYVLGPAKRKDTSLDPLAMRLDVAHLLFDYGRRVDPADQQAAPAAPAESKEQRQDRRLQVCIDANLPMTERALLRLPDGVGALAELEGVKRQTFTEDVKAALRRKVERERPKPRLVKPPK
ncbi:MAG TPA: hypothetical protein PKC60_00355 [Hydrogenophaga sp.]|nr:hypothetical protein [Hydrogenophaga sp.]